MPELIVIAICLTLNALLSGAEMAFVTVAKSRLREQARSGNHDAQKILNLRDTPERTLSVIQIGITLLGALAAAVGGASAEESLSPILQERLNISENTAEFLSIPLVILPLTYFSVVVGELVPKTLALRNPLGFSLKSARWLKLADSALSPAVTFLEWLTKKFISTFFRRIKPADTAALVADTVELSDLSHQTRQYVLNLVSLEKKRIKDIYLPWDRVLSIDCNQSLNEVEKVVISSGHTRIPVMESGEVVGLINTKEFLAQRAAGKEDWKPVIRPAVRVQESDALIKALRAMQEKRSHLSIVYAGTQLVGIVTMEDILEEVIGDVLDEDDDGAIRRILSTGVTFRTLGPQNRE